MDSMRRFLLTRVGPVVAAIAAVVVFVLVLYGRPAQKLQPRVPETVGATSDAQSLLDATTCRLRLFEGKPAESIPGLWPQFRGPNRDNISPESAALLKTWPKEGPRKLWSVELGEGYAGPAIRNGRMYVLDYDPPDHWFLREDDIKDWSAVARFLDTADKGPAGTLTSMPAAQTQATQTQAADTQPDETGRKAILGRINALLSKLQLKQLDLASLKLPPETRRYLVPEGGFRATITPAEVLRFNRIALEALLGDAIAKSQHADVMRCLSLADGKDIWRLSYPVKIKPDHGVSRTVPAVTDKYVVSLGPKCHVVCLDAVSGKFRWGVDLVSRYQTEVPLWYAGQCPIIDGDRVIVAPGGTSLMIALDLATGKVLWETPNPRRWKMTHSTVAIQELGGKKIYVYCAGDNVAGGVVGVDAQTGNVLWETTLWKISTTVPTPICLPDGRVFLSGGYGAGSMMMKIVPEGDKFAAKELWRLEAKDYGSVQQTPILWKDHIYGTRPDGQLVCLDLDGQIKWTSGTTNRFGQALGSYMIADGMLFLLNDLGTLTLAEASADGYRQLAQAKVLDDHDSWGPMALTAGRLLVRDFTRMVCLDVSTESK